MTGSPPPAWPGGARVLVLGRSPEVLEAVMRELSELGLAVAGSSEPEGAAERFDAREFDLVTLGRGLRGPAAERLKRQFLARNPGVRLLETFAPRAVREVIAALDLAPPPAVDLAAYCARIGYAGPMTPTLATLEALCALHPAAIPFEAIDVLLGRPIDLAPAAVDAKLIHGRRGGYCFEQNGLFQRVLDAIGFKVESLSARVRWMAPPGAPPRARTHMCLRVTLEDVPWLVDVGFGQCVPTSPLRLDHPGPQPTAHETFRVFPFGDALLVQARLGGIWMPLVEVGQEPQVEADHELANWFTATHPQSLFRQRLIAARTTPQARFALLDGRLTIRRPDGRSEQAMLDAVGIERVLAETFGLPVEPAWRRVIERVAAIHG